VQTMDGHKVEFTREIPKTDPREIWADGGKWKSFFLTLQEAREAGATTLVVASADVLGDTWRELMLNLSAIADAGLVLEIQPSKTHSVTRNEVDFSTGEEVDLWSRTVFDRVDPKTGEREPGRKYGPFTLKAGNGPPILLHSEGPDENYCRAELLMMRDQEEYRPTAKNREIQGRYEVTGGTVEWFLHKYADKSSQGVIEDYRRQIQEKGWEAFCVSVKKSEEIPISTDEARKLANRMNPINHDVSKKDWKIIKELKKKLKD